MKARFAIMRALIRANDELLHIEMPHDSSSDPTIALDSAKLFSHARPALAQLLLHLHVSKSTADTARGVTLFEELSTVDGEMLDLRHYVVSHKTPRKQFVQANTFLLTDGVVELKEYEASAAGIVQSWAERKV